MNICIQTRIHVYKYVPLEPHNRTQAYHPQFLRRNSDKFIYISKRYIYIYIDISIYTYTDVPQGPHTFPRDI